MNTPPTSPASQLALQQPGDVTDPPVPEAAAEADADAQDEEDAAEDAAEEGGADAGEAAATAAAASAAVVKKTVEHATAAAKAAPERAKPAVKKATAAPARRRRGPPADGAPEARVLAIAATSKMSDANGVRIRRGAVVSVPERRLSSLLTAARIRKATEGELEIARRRHGEYQLP